MCTAINIFFFSSPALAVPWCSFGGPPEAATRSPQACLPIRVESEFQQQQPTCLIGNYRLSRDVGASRRPARNRRYQQAADAESADSSALSFGRGGRNRPSCFVIGCTTRTRDPRINVHLHMLRDQMWVPSVWQRRRWIPRFGRKYWAAREAQQK